MIVLCISELSNEWSEFQSDTTPKRLVLFGGIKERIAYRFVLVPAIQPYLVSDLIRRKELDPTAFHERAIKKNSLQRINRPMGLK